jgi:hypothetical protein
MLSATAVNDKDAFPWLQSGLVWMARRSGVWRKVYIQAEDIKLQVEAVSLYLEDIHL